MSDFVIDANIKRYAERLRTDDDPAARATVRALLIEEENRFGFRAEQLAKTDDYIADCDHRIEKQRALIEGLRARQRDWNAALRLLSNLMELLALFRGYRQMIVDALARDAHSEVVVRHYAVEVQKLSAREIEVLTLAAEGNTSDQVAAHLDIARRTVDAHMQAILNKLGAENRAHAVAKALSAGIIKFN